MKNILNIILSFSLFSMLFCIEEKNENTSFDNEFKNLSTFPLTGSISSSDCTFETSASAGLNPISIVQSFRLPRDLRRDTNTDFRLRFLNSNMEYVQNLNKNKIIG